MGQIRNPESKIRNAVKWVRVILQEFRRQRNRGLIIDRRGKFICEQEDQIILLIHTWQIKIAIIVPVMQRCTGTCSAGRKGARIHEYSAPVILVESPACTDVIA